MPAGRRSRDAPSPEMHGVCRRPQPPAGDEWLAGAEVARESGMRAARDQHPDARTRAEPVRDGIELDA